MRQSKAMKLGRQIPLNLLIALIHIYRYIISPSLPQACRFHPTCSEYAILSLKHFGFFIGIWQSLKRIASCHPFSSKNSYDPVINNQRHRQ